MSAAERRRQAQSSVTVDTARMAADLLNAPMPAFAEALFLIDEADTGEEIPLVVNDAQEIVYREIRRQEKLKRPVRILILKGRQQGMSTFCQAFIAWKMLTKPGIRVAVVGHELEAVGELYSKLEVIINGLPEWWGASIVSSKEGRRLRLHNKSRVRYDSAHRPGKVGRGGTRQILHLTEGPQWADEDESMQALDPVLHDVPGTYGLVETTAKGASGWFYEMFVEGMRKLARGEEPEWVPIFVPWFKTKHYQRARRPGEPVLTDAEKARRDEFGLTDEQMYWYRDKARSLRDKVAEEYPFTWREAFLHSGWRFFRADALDHYEGKLGEYKPIKQGLFRDAGAKAIFEKRDRGPTHVYASPVKADPARGIVAHRYSVGVDFASGRYKDKSAIVVIDWDGDDGPEIVATHSSKLLPDAVLYEAYLLARAYNDAVIVPDRNGLGSPMVDRLREAPINYRNIYIERDTKNVRRTTTARYGISTQGGNRLGILEDAADLIHKQAITVPCYRLFGEMETFVFTDASGERPEAEGNQNDDLVMAFAYAVAGGKQLPAVQEPPRESTHRARVSSVTGY